MVRGGGTPAKSGGLLSGPQACLDQPGPDPGPAGTLQGEPGSLPAGGYPRGGSFQPGLYHDDAGQAGRGETGLSPGPGNGSRAANRASGPGQAGKPGPHR